MHEQRTARPYMLSQLTHKFDWKSSERWCHRTTREQPEEQTVRREDWRTARLPERRVVNVGVEVFVGEVQRPFLWHKESFSQWCCSLSARLINKLYDRLTETSVLPLYPPTLWCSGWECPSLLSPWPSSTESRDRINSEIYFKCFSKEKKDTDAAEPL